jgi:hypothetical protein
VARIGGMRTRLLALLLGLLVAALAPSAHADGLPVEGVDASLSGVLGPGRDGPRYVTLPAEKGTVVAAVDAVGGQVLKSRYVAGRFTVPVVAYDGSASGLSADGSTLVLIRPRLAFPRRTTSFAVVGTKRLRPRDVFTLQGDFSFDALSPDGRWLYLVQYLSKRDPTRYLVRLYDLQRGRMLPEPIIDPQEVGDVMRGMPVTRASSPGGRFAYTLYDGAGEHPFIHALDTVERSARCIDLHGLMGFEFLSELQLDVSPDGGTLSIVHGQEPLVLVDTRTNEVTEPAEPTAPPQPDTSGSAPKDEPRTVPWPLIAGGAVALLLLLVGGQRLLKGLIRRRAPEPPEVLGGVGNEVEVELRDPLLDDAPHGLPEVGHEAHEPERPRVLVP